MQINYGTRATLGVINISSCANLEPEFYAMAPPGVAILTARVPLPQTTPEQLAKLATAAEQAAQQLATAQPDLILFACTSGSFINGKGYDTQTAGQLSKAAGGIPVLTTATALLHALQALEVQTFSLATPYIESVNQRAVAYFSANGYTITKTCGLGLDTDFAIGLQTLDTVRKLAIRVACPQAQAVVLSCTNLKTIPILDELEQTLGKPVISANQATLWYALRTLGITDQLPGLGRLFQLPSTAPERR